MTPKERLHFVLKTRLQQLSPMIKFWPQALGILASPAHVASSIEKLAITIDEICWQAGDRSTDFDWYTKRTAVSAIYTTTELYMITDGSPNFRDTWNFLDRRLEDMVTTTKLTAQFGMGLELLINSASSLLANLNPRKNSPQ
jgi:ubiquinone biosynthesis protein COQ9